MRGCIDHGHRGTCAPTQVATRTDAEWEIMRIISLPQAGKLPVGELSAVEDILAQHVKEAVLSAHPGARKRAIVTVDNVMHDIGELAVADGTLTPSVPGRMSNRVFNKRLRCP